MRWLFVALIGASALLGLWFVIELGRPWHSELPPMAWLQTTIASAAVAFDVVLLLALLRVPVPMFVFALIVAAQDGVFAWRLVRLHAARREDRGRSMTTVEIPETGGPAVPPRIRTIAYFVGLAVGGLTILATGITAAVAPQAVGTVLAITGAVTGATTFILGGLGAAFRPTAVTTIPPISSAEAVRRLYDPEDVRRPGGLVE
jgi:hypothetical protein